MPGSLTFKPNWSLDKAIGAAMSQIGHGLSERAGIRVLIGILIPGD